MPEEHLRIRRSSMVEKVRLRPVERLGDRPQRSRRLPLHPCRPDAGHLEIELTASTAGGDDLERHVPELPAEVRGGRRQPLGSERLPDAEPDGGTRSHARQHPVHTRHLLGQPLTGVHRAAAGVGREQAPLLADEERRASSSLHPLQLRLQRLRGRPQRPSRAGERAVTREGEDEPELLPGKDHAPGASPGTFTLAKVWPGLPQPKNGIGTKPGRDGTRSSHLRIAGYGSSENPPSGATWVYA